MASLSLGIGIFLYSIKMIVSGKNRNFRRTVFDLPIAIFTIISGLSVAVSPDPAFSFYNYYNLVGRYVLTYLLVVQNVTTLRQIQQIVYALGVSALMVVLYGFHQYIFGIDISAMKWVDGEAFPELKLAYFQLGKTPIFWRDTLMSSCLLYLECFAGWKIGNRGCYSQAFCLLAICLSMTYARGACLSMALVIAGYGVLKDRRILLGCIALAALLLAVQPEVLN